MRIRFQVFNWLARRARGLNQAASHDTVHSRPHFAETTNKREATELRRRAM